MSISKDKIFSDTIINAISKILTIIITFFVISILISNFGIEKYGVFVLLTSIFLHANIFEFGLGAYLTKKISENVEISNEKINELISTNLVVALFFSVLIIAPFILFAENIYLLFSINEIYWEELNTTLNILSIYFIINIILFVIVRVFQGFHQYKYIQYIEIVKKIFLLIFLIVIDIFSLVTILNVASVYLVSTIFALFFGLYLFKKNINISLDIKKFSWNELKLGLKYSSSLFLGKMIAFLGYKINFYLVGYYFGIKYVAYLDIAFKLWQVPSIMYAILTTTTLSYTASIFKNNGKEALFNFYKNYSKYMIFLILPIIVLLIIYHIPIITFWLGIEEGLENISLMVVPMLISFMFLLFYGLLSEISISLDHYKFSVKYNFIFTLCGLIISIYFMKRGDIIGATIGMPIVSFLMMIYFNNFYIKFFDFNIFNILKEYIKYFILMAFIITMLFVSYREYSYRMQITIIVGMFIVYLVGIYFILNDEEKNFLKAKLKKR